MANIRIEKKNTSILPWLLGLLALIVVAFLAVELFDSDDDDLAYVETEESYEGTAAPTAYADTEQGMSDVGTYAAEAAAYEIELNRLEAEMGLDHDYSSAVFKQLARSLQAMSNELDLSNAEEVRATIDRLYQTADRLDQNWRSPEHADMIRKTGEQVLMAVSTIQQNRFPALAAEVQELQTALYKIDPQTLTLNQKDAVKGFFRQAVTTMNAMHGYTG